MCNLNSLKLRLKRSHSRQSKVIMSQTNHIWEKNAKREIAETIWAGFHPLPTQTHTYVAPKTTTLEKTDFTTFYVQMCLIIDVVG